MRMKRGCQSKAKQNRAEEGSEERGRRGGRRRAHGQGGGAGVALEADFKRLLTPITYGINRGSECMYALHDMNIGRIRTVGLNRCLDVFLAPP